MCLPRSYSVGRRNFMRHHYNKLNIKKNFLNSSGIQEDSSYHIKNNKFDSDLLSAASDIAIIGMEIVGHDDADTLLVKDQYIVGIGTYDKLKDRITAKTHIIKLDDGVVLPGLCDSHIHLMIGAEHYQGCDVEGIESFDEFSAKVKEFAGNNPDLDAIHVYGLHYTEPPVIPSNEARQYLDRIIDSRPLFVYAHDLHTGWANTRALEAAGIFHAMPPWPEVIDELDMHDNIELDEQNIPTGELREPESYFLVEGQVRTDFPVTVEQKLEYLKDACQYLASKGICSVHNMGLDLPEEDYELLLLLIELEEKGELPIRVSSSFSVVPDEHMLSDINNAAKIRDVLRECSEGRMSTGELHQFLLEELKEASMQRHHACGTAAERYEEIAEVPKSHRECSARIHSMIYDIHVRPHLERLSSRMKSRNNRIVGERSKIQVHGVKIFMDGVIEKNTAYRKDCSPIEGIPAFSDSELDSVVEAADKSGLQVCAHCIGDASVNVALNAVEKVRKLHQNIDQKRGHKIRHRIEHIEMCEPEDISRFHAYQVIPSMQPLHERPPVTMWHELVPESHWGTAFAWRDMLDSGSTLAFGSDWPIVSCNCLDALHRAVNRKSWKEGLKNQGVNFSEGLAGFSFGNAYAEYQENIRGKLEVGRLADIAVFKGKLDTQNPSSDDLKCVYTICDGEIVYSAD